MSHLWVIWGEPDDGTRRVIGELWRDDSGFAFGYGHDLEKAREKGFRLLAEFPAEQSVGAPYRSRYLFATFAQRIPSPKRGDFDRVMQSWGVTDVDNPLEALARSGGVQMTDRIELAEHRSPLDDLHEPLLVRIAGMNRHPGSVRIQTGESLSLVREPQNTHDTQATMIVAQGGEKAGYVPRQYGSIVARLLDAGVALEAVAVRQLGVPADAGRWVVRIARAAESSESLRDDATPAAPS